MNPEEIEVIDWWDHNSADGWLTAAQIDNEPALVRSVGWVLFESDQCLTLVQSGPADETGDSYNGVITIIRAAIVKRQKVVLA